MKSGKTYEDVIADPALKQVSEKLSDILENVWNIGKLTNEEYKVFDDCIMSPAGRK